MPSEMAARMGSTIFERVHKAGNLGPWERGLSERPHLTPGNITAAMIGQSFALLSGDSTHRSLADTYHGCLLSVTTQSILCFHDRRLTTPCSWVAI